MITQISSHLQECSQATRILAMSIGPAVFLLVLIFIVSQYFKPTGKRKLIDGRSSHLPPGPKGLPLLGSLLDLKTGRQDPNHKFVRSAILRNDY